MLDYRLIEKPAFTVVGKGIRVTTQGGDDLRRIPAFWNESVNNGFLEQLGHLKKGSSLLQRLAHIIHGEIVVEDVLLGVCTDTSADETEFTYLIAVEAAPGPVPQGLVERAVPAATWAVFEVVGPMPDAIQAVWADILSDFLPNGPFVHANGPDLELYPDGDDSKSRYHSEVWVPVVRR